MGPHTAQVHILVAPCNRSVPHWYPGGAIRCVSTAYLIVGRRSIPDRVDATGVQIPHACDLAAYAGSVPDIA
eukprot:148310-Rhodomonas_salina.2